MTISNPAPAAHSNPLLECFPFVLLALTLWREARGCSYAEKVAIAHVIFNRTTDRLNRWPKTLAAAICQPAQFTSIAPPPHITPMEMANATTWPKDGDVQFADCCRIAEEFALHPVPDDTCGATHYYSEPIASPPPWANPERMTLHLGVFRFYRL